MSFERGLMAPGLMLLALSGCTKESSSEPAASSDAGRTPRPTESREPDSTPEPEPVAEPEGGPQAGAGGEREPVTRPSERGGAGGNAQTPEAGKAGVGASTPDAGDTPATGGTSGEGGGGGADASTGGTPITPEPTPEGRPVAVAVGYGMRRVSSRNGLDWEYFEEIDPDGGDDDNLFRGLTFGGGRFVAVGGSGQSLSLVSSDGQSWEAEDRDQGAWMGGVGWLNGEFVVAGGNGLRLHSEDLGETWLDPVGYQAIHYRDVASGRGVVVAVGHTYGETPDVGIIATTGDGRSWTEVGHSGARLGRVAFGNGRFVATGDDGRVSRSPDGESWQDETVGSGGGSVVFVNGEFMVSNSDGVFRSADGVEWTPVDGAVYGIDGYIDGYYLALGWPAVIRASRDLVDWELVFDPGGSGLTRIVTGYLE